MKYDFDKIIDRRGTYASKTDAMPEGCPEDRPGLLSYGQA